MGKRLPALCVATFLAVLVAGCDAPAEDPSAKQANAQLCIAPMYGVVWYNPRSTPQDPLGQSESGEWFGWPLVNQTVNFLGWDHSVISVQTDANGMYYAEIPPGQGDISTVYENEELKVAKCYPSGLGGSDYNVACWQGEYVPQFDILVLGVDGGFAGPQNCLSFGRDLQ